MSEPLVVVASTFTSTPLEASLAGALESAGASCRVTFVQYGVLAQYLLSPESLFGASRVAATVVLFRFEDYLRGVDIPESADRARSDVRERLSDNATELTDQLRIAAQRGGPLFVLGVPSRGFVATRHRLSGLTTPFTNLVLARASGLPNVRVLRWKDFEAQLAGRSVVDDAGGDRLAQIPFTQECFDMLGGFIGNRIAQAVQGASTQAIGACEPSTGLALYLRSLQVRVRMTRVTDELCRAADHLFLTVAAFNTAGEGTVARRAQEVLGTQQESMWLVYVQDRTSDYGPSGLVVCAVRDRCLHVSTLLLNCRILGKQVEHSVTLAIGDLARAHACDAVVFEFHSSPRNELAGYFVRNLCNSAGSADGTHLLPLDALPTAVASLATAPDVLTFEIAGLPA
jgi:hypothetical protein